MAIHPRESLASFQNGEVRLLYARNRGDPSGSLYYLKDGTANQLRSWAKEHLECFMPECSDRRLTTVARSGMRRDGFRHFKGGGGHAPEGLFHEQAKVLIMQWVSDQYPHVRARAEETTKDRERRADVMLTWPDGSQLAIEVQYAPLTIPNWRARHHSYRQKGLECVWLFGHRPPHLQTLGSQTDVVRLSDLHKSMVSEAIPLLWINPIEAKVASILSSLRIHECLIPFCGDLQHQKDFAVEVTDSETNHYLAIESLTDCLLTPQGIVPASLAQARSKLTALDHARKIESQRLALEAAEIDRRKREEESKKLEIEATRRTERSRRLTAQRARGLQEPNYPVLSASKYLSKSLKCSMCGQRLDPVLEDIGHHSGCWCPKCPSSHFS